MKLFAIGVLMRVLSWITPQMAERIAPALAAVLWRLSTKKRRVTLVNLQAVYPHMDTQHRYEIARASMVHYVRGVLEAGMIWHWSPERILQHLDESRGLEHLHAAMDMGNGVILATPHCGSWELAGQFIQPILHCTVLYKPGRHPDVEALLLEKRRRAGIAVVPANAAGLRVLYKTIKAGGAIGVLPDQEPTRGEGEFAPFYGIETLTGVLVPRIAHRTGTRVVFVLCKRCDGGRYRLHFLPTDQAISSQDTRAALTALNEGIERTIEIDTTQYLWAYKRFRNRPEGEPPFYK